MSRPGDRRTFRRLAAVASATAAAAALTGAVPGPAAAQDSNPLGTATATAGQVNLDVRLLGGLLGPLRLGGGTANGLDIPLDGLVLGQASAPTANGDAANFTNSTVRLRDGLISTLHLSGDSADLIKADAASGTARVVRAPGAYTQAYATVANLRLFLPLVTLPGADASNGILKIDAVSAQATCVPGQKPVASAKTPATIVLLGRQIPVPLSGDVPLDLGVAKVDVHLSPVTTTDSAGAAASVEARISVDAAGLVQAGGAIILASAACTSPAAAATGTSAAGGQAATGGGTGQDPATGVPIALTADGPQTPMPDTGAPAGLVQAAGAALAALVGGVILVSLSRRRRAASEAAASGAAPEPGSGTGRKPED